MAAHSHTNELPGTIKFASINFPPVRTRFVKLTVDQSKCPTISQTAVVNELQVRNECSGIIMINLNYRAFFKGLS